MADPLLKLTDGTTDISLLTEEGQFGLHLDDWTPIISNYKGEGIWRSSSLADGRRLVDRKWANVVETFEVKADGYEQDSLARQMQDTRRLLEKAASYWAANWQDEPVWIEARAACETNTRYGLVYVGHIPADDNPYSQPFFKEGNAVLDDLSLLVERLPWWLGFAPGQDCDEDDQGTETQTDCFPSYLELDGDTSDIDCGAAGSLDNLPDNAVAGKGPVTVEAWIRADSYGEGNTGRIAVKGSADPTTRGWHILVLVGIGLRVDVNCATQDARSQTNLTEFSADGLWHHVLFCYDETGAGTPAARTVYIAVDGVWSAVAPVTVSIGNYSQDGADSLFIGNNSAGTAGFDGGIGWARVSDNIRYDPAAGNFTPEPRCELPTIDANVMCQVIYEGTGTTTYDRSGNDNDGTISNCTWACTCVITDTDIVDCNCVQASGEQNRWEYDGVWAVQDAQPVGEVHHILELSSGRLLACEGSAEVWRSDDGTAPWTASTTPPAGLNCWAMVEAWGNVFLVGRDGAGNVECWRSTNDGVDWVQRSASITGAVGGVGTGSITALGNYLYIADTQSGVWRSIDRGATWAQVLTGIVSLVYAWEDALYVDFYISTTNYILQRSTDDGATWNTVLTKNDILEFYFIRGLSNGYLYVGGTSLYRSLNGIDWELIADFPLGQQMQDIGLTATGLFYAILIQADILYRGDGFSDWETLVSAAGGLNSPWTLCVYSVTDIGYMGGGAGDTNIWKGPNWVDVGREATCLDETFIANKANIAQLTDIFVYDASTTTYVPQFPAAIFPYFLLPSPVAVGDMVYFCIDSTIVDRGPYCSLVFDLTQVLATTGATTLVWEYSQGAAAWATLNVHDETEVLDPLGAFGVNGIYWVPPSDWAVDTIAAVGVTGLWIRLQVTALGTWLQSPMQGNRDVYTVNWPCVDVDDAQVRGDIPALLRVKAHNRSDEDYYDTKDELDTLDNRVLVGLRTLSRGSQFTAYINIAKKGVVANGYPQNPAGISASDGTGTTTGTKITAPCGIACVHTTPPTGSLTTYADAATITLGSPISREFYGTYHVFLRAQLEEPAAAPAGDDSSVRVRLKVQSGSGGISKITRHRRFVGWDENGETFKDWQLLDFGRIDLPVTDLFKTTELPDEFSIVVQISSAAATNLEVNLYDLILMPVDEWSGDFIDSALEDDSGVGNGYALDIDSLSYPKRRIRSLVRSADASEFIRASYQPITPGPAILQANADQRLWFLSARAVYLGEDTAGGGATLTDDHADFLRAGVRAGMVAYNITDSTSATITSVTQTTCVCDAAIWAAGEDYMIICNGIYRSEPWNAHSVQLFHNPRYLSFRGDR